MPTYNNYCRSPLVDPVFAPLPDGAVRTAGSLKALSDRVLEMVKPDNLPQADAVLASKLGEYPDLPQTPDLMTAAAALPDRLHEFLDAMRAAIMIAVANKNKEEMLKCLKAMRTFGDALADIDEYTLMPEAADAMRCLLELYRRTGQAFLLEIMEMVRSQVPDVSGLFHSFPFLKKFTPETVPQDAMDDTSKYFRRMKMLGNGKNIADALALTALFTMYSGSARDANASNAGLTSLDRFHGIPGGMFTADPYLAGREPSSATELNAICSTLEALHDLLSAGGDPAVADRMERIVENAFANIFAKGGVFTKQAVNREANEPTCEAVPPQRADTSAVLRAMTAVRRSVWMVKSETELAMLLPYDSSCMTRLNGVPVRVSAATNKDGNLVLNVETKQPVQFTLTIRVPDYCETARIMIGGQKSGTAEGGSFHEIKKVFTTGDQIVLDMTCRPYIKTGHRGSVSVFYRAMLMALPLPNPDDAWQYALSEKAKPSLVWADDRPSVKMDACIAPGWTVKNGQIPSPPQGIVMGEAYELTLLPYQNTVGRVAVFPKASVG